MTGKEAKEILSNYGKFMLDIKDLWNYLRKKHNDIFDCDDDFEFKHVVNDSLYFINSKKIDVYIPIKFINKTDEEIDVLCTDIRGDILRNTSNIKIQQYKNEIDRCKQEIIQLQSLMRVETEYLKDISGDVKQSDDIDKSNFVFYY